MYYCIFFCVDFILKCNYFIYFMEIKRLNVVYLVLIIFFVDSVYLNNCFLVFFVYLGLISLIGMSFIIFLYID